MNDRPIFRINPTPERLRILIEMGTTAFVNVIPPEAHQILSGKSSAERQELLLNAMHKARYENKHVPAHLRHFSRVWLEKNGHDRTGGIPWPPEGELPT